MAYAPGRRDRLDHTLTLSVVEVASRAIDGAVIVLTPKDAPPRLLQSQASASDLPVGATGDSAFDAVYNLRLNPPEAAGQLSSALRSAILDLGRKGPAGRPCVVFLPGYLAVLFPTNLSDLAFHVPPYWVPIDADALLAQFASDLAVKNSLINAVLALPGAETST